MRPDDDSNPGEVATSFRERRASCVALAGVLLLGLVLALTLPQKVDKRISMEITCVSGAPVVGVWVETENGGSGFSEPSGDLPANTGPYLFDLDFGGAYRVNVGCGGSLKSWKKGTSSATSDHSNRLLVCDDTVSQEPGPCRDLP